MASVSYVGKVLGDGHLSLPKKAREELKLEPGQEVEVIVRIREATEQLTELAFEPLQEIIGLAKTGRIDGAVNHDRYL